MHRTPPCTSLLPWHCSLTLPLVFVFYTCIQKRQILWKALLALDLCVCSPAAPQIKSDLYFWVRELFHTIPALVISPVLPKLNGHWRRLTSLGVALFMNLRPQSFIFACHPTTCIFPLDLERNCPCSLCLTFTLWWWNLHLFFMEVSTWCNSLHCSPYSHVSAWISVAV